MTTQASAFLYRPPGVTEPIKVRRLSAETVTPEVGLAAGELLIAAWSAQLEEPNGPLPAGRLRQAMLGNSPDARRQAAVQRARRIRYYMREHDSQYWVVDGGQDIMLSLAKVSPEDDGSMYVNDVLTLPSRQRQRLGACSLRSALVSFGKPDDTRVTLDAFAGSAVNAWFEGLGFEYIRDLLESYEIDSDYSLPQQHYGNVTLATVAQHLTERTGLPQPPAAA